MIAKLAKPRYNSGAPIFNYWVINCNSFNNSKCKEIAIKDLHITHCVAVGCRGSSAAGLTPLAPSGSPIHIEDDDIRSLDSDVPSISCSWNEDSVNALSLATTARRYLLQ